MKWEYRFASILGLLRKSGSLRPGTTVRILRYEERLIFRTKCIVEGTHEAWELAAGYPGSGGRYGGDGMPRVMLLDDARVVCLNAGEQDLKTYIWHGSGRSGSQVQATPAGIAELWKLIELDKLALPELDAAERSAFQELTEAA
jgi:hypothetical protein